MKLIRFDSFSLHVEHKVIRRKRLRIKGISSPSAYASEAMLKEKHPNRIAIVTYELDKYWIFISFAEAERLCPDPTSNVEIPDFISFYWRSINNRILFRNGI